VRWVRGGLSDTVPPNGAVKRPNPSYLLLYNERPGNTAAWRKTSFTLAGRTQLCGCHVELCLHAGDIGGVASWASSKNHSVVVTDAGADGRQLKPVTRAPPGASLWP
jgi:hypothetical protein